MSTIDAVDTLYIFSVLDVKYNAFQIYSKCLFPLATQKFPAGKIFDDDLSGRLGMKLQVYLSKLSVTYQHASGLFGYV